MRATTLFFFGLISTIATVGCSGTDGPSDDVEEMTTGDAEGALTAKKHFAADNVELSWRPGCGMRMPDGQTCYQGLELAYQKTYVALKVSVTTTVNNTSDTIKVKLDTYSTQSNMPIAWAPLEKKELGTPKRLQHMKTYAATVVDYQGNTLWSGEIRAVPAP
jgi:hypothetical protein